MLDTVATLRNLGDKIPFVQVICNTEILLKFDRSFQLQLLGNS